MNQNNDEQLEEVEKKLRERADRDKIGKDKVSGKSVFELQRIITKKRKKIRTKKYFRA